MKYICDCVVLLSLIYIHVYYVGLCEWEISVITLSAHAREGCSTQFVCQSVSHSVTQQQILKMAASQ